MKSMTSSFFLCLFLWGRGSVDVNINKAAELSAILSELKRLVG